MRWLYIALNRTPNIDCYWMEAVPNLNRNPKPFSLAPAPIFVSSGDDARKAKLFHAHLGFRAGLTKHESCLYDSYVMRYAAFLS